MQKSAGSVLVRALLPLALFGCAPRVAAPATVDVSVPQATAAEPSAPAALPALTPDEQAASGRLRATVQHLAVEIGERNIDKSWNLASATDDLAISLEKLGYEVRRQGIVAGDAVVQNLEARVSGGEHGGEVIVVGAHFDTLAGTPGADQNASGAAAVMELARAFHGAKAKRALHFALFVNAAAPYYQTDQMGSLVYAKGLKAQGLDVRGMLNLDGLGVYAPGPPMRPYPAEVMPPYPSTSDFLAILGNEASRSLLEQVTGSMKTGGVPVIGTIVPPELPFAANSDHWAFWKLGIPALLLTDAAEFRYRDYKQKTDLPDKLDFDRMARVVTSLEKVVGELVEASSG